MSSSSAMSLPPHSIRVKRQRNDDPVPALYIENAKRRRLSKEFVFRLARTVDSPVGDHEVPPSPKKQDSTRGRGASTSTVTSPTATSAADDAKDAASSSIASPTSDPMAISPTLPSAQPPLAKPGGKAQDVKDTALSRPRTPTPMVKTTTEANAAAAAMAMDPDLLSPGTKTEIRRFHLSKRVKLDPYGHGASSPTGGGKKRERNVISVFMEGSGRVAKKRSLNRLEYIKGGRDGMPEGTTTPSIKLTEPGDERRKPKTHPMEKAMIEQRKSREHSRSREEDGGSEYHTPQEHLPAQTQTQQQNQKQQQQQQKGKQDWELETDELTQQLQAMVMDYIANQPATNLTPSAAKETKPIRKKKPSSSRAKAEPPAKAETAAAESTAMERSASAVDTADSKLTLDDAAADPGLLPDDAEGDWVYDVYVREELKPELDASGQLVGRVYPTATTKNGGTKTMMTVIIKYGIVTMRTAMPRTTIPTTIPMRNQPLIWKNTTTAKGSVIAVWSQRAADVSPPLMTRSTTLMMTYLTLMMRVMAMRYLGGERAKNKSHAQ